MRNTTSSIHKETSVRNLEVIENELAAAREALSHVEGTPAEVYSRIVGYYRSVRNWNKGKREEYGERLMFKPDESLLASCTAKPAAAPVLSPAAEKAGRSAEAEKAAAEAVPPEAGESARLLLFVRPACPSCPSAKAAAGQLGIPLELYDADTDEGLAEAVRRNVLSTPTAILVSPSGTEMGRARDADGIGRLLAG
jgi:ribonucleoside-triphosphate reductase